MDTGTKNLKRTSINPLRIQRTFRDTQDITRGFNNTSDLSFSVIPYSLTLGATDTSEAGYRNQYSQPIDFTTFQRAFGGRNALSLQWDNSYTLTDKDGNTKDGYWEQIFQVGDVFKGIINDNSTGIGFEPSPQFGSATSQLSTKTIQLTFTLHEDGDGNWEQNNKLLDNLYNEEFRFYRIPEYEAEKDNKDGNIYDWFTNKQWYYISNVNIIYEISDKKAKALEITFSTVNNKIIKSGFSVVNYLQVSAPGSSYAEPKLDENREIILDPEYLTPRPITHADIDIYGNSAINSVLFVGRPIELIKDDNGNIIGQKIFAPRIIYPFSYQAPQYNQLRYNSIPVSNYYYSKEGTPLILGFLESWKQKIQASYNVAAGEIAKYEGFLKTNETDTKLTNVSIPSGQQQPFWDEGFLNYSTDKSKIDQSYSTLGSEYFFADPHEMDNRLTKLSLGLTTFNYKDITANSSLPLINLLNGLISKQTPQLPEELNQTTPFALNSIPVVGGFLNDITFGMQLGFKSLSTLNQPQNIPLPFLIPIQSYEAGLDHWTSPLARSQAGTTNNPFGLIADPAQNQGLIPMDAFKNNTEDTPSALYGTNTVTTAFAFNLSDKIKLAPTNINSGDISQTQDTISTRELGQFKDYDPTGANTPTEMYLVNQSIEIESPTSDFNNKEIDERGYLIDGIILTSLNKSDYKITFFSQPTNYNGDIDNNNAIWTATWNSVSKVSNNIRQWLNYNQLSFPLYDFLEEKKFNYPQKVEQGIPPNTKSFTKTVKVSWNSLSLQQQADTSVKEGTDKWTNQWDNFTKTFTGTSDPAQTFPDYSITGYSVSIPYKVSQEGSFKYQNVNYSYTGRNIYNGIIKLDSNKSTNDLYLKNLDSVKIQGGSPSIQYSLEATSFYLKSSSGNSPNDLVVESKIQLNNNIFTITIDNSPEVPAITETSTLVNVGIDADSSSKLDFSILKDNIIVELIYTKN